MAWDDDPNERDVTDQELRRWALERDMEEMECDLCGMKANRAVTASDGERIALCDKCIKTL